jgi:hypothetical protein
LFSSFCREIIAHPLRFELRHCFLARCRVAPVKRALRPPRGDRPKPGRLARRRVRPHDAADLAAIAVEHHEVVILAKPGGLKCQHGVSIAATPERASLTTRGAGGALNARRGSEDYAV